MTRSLLLLGLFMLAFLVLAQRAVAHPMPDSYVKVRIAEDRWRVSMELPNDRLGMALVNVGAIPDPGPGFTEYPPFPSDVVADYVRDHLRVVTSDGRDWRIRIISLQDDVGERGDWLVEAEATPPEGADARSGTLHYDVIIRQVIPDVAMVSLAQDWRGGMVEGEPRLLGALSLDDRSLAIAGGEGGEWTSLFAMFRIGVHHILEGLDHLAFLLTLMLPVAMVAQGRRWAPLPEKRPAIGNALWRVSAFTIGHTLSLLAVSLGWLPPAGPVIEIVIALSVAIAAVHAIRPIYPGREIWIAVFFGLIHGMAFATVIRDMALSTGSVVAATLFFNLGIEAVQIAMVLVALPALILLRFHPQEPGVRTTLAAIAFLAAIYWIVERVPTAV